VGVRPAAVGCARLGINAQDVERQLNAIFLGQVATQVRESALRMTDVRVRYPDRLRFGTGRFRPGLVLNQWLLLPEAAPLPADVSPASAARQSPIARAGAVSAVARLEPRRTPDEQWRENQRPVHYLTAELKEGAGGLGQVVTDIRREMAKVDLPTGYRWEMGGHYIKQQEAFR